MNRTREQEVARLREDIADYENNLKHFASGKVRALPGELASSQRALTNCKARLEALLAVPSESPTPDTQ